MRPSVNRRRFLSLAAATTALPLLPRAAFAATPLTMQAAWINDAEFAGFGVFALTRVY